MIELTLAVSVFIFVFGIALLALIDWLQAFK
jgi:hypothetical protein